jgi:TetR/AcrR family transcriptional regulator, transcriptional repressor for nem operon
MKSGRGRFAANRIEILGAASRLCREKGFDEVGLDAVIKAAGLTHGVFYSHVRFKDDLVVATSPGSPSVLDGAGVICVYSHS